MQNLNENLTIAIIGLISLGIGYFTYFLNKYIDKINLQIKDIKGDNERKLFENALADFQDIVLKTVTFAEQVTVKQLKEKSSDGKLTKEDIILVGEEVLKSVLNNITTSNKTVLQKNIVDIEEYAKKSIESKVFEISKKS